jgi:hypothetical protein
MRPSAKLPVIVVVGALAVTFPVWVVGQDRGAASSSVQGLAANGGHGHWRGSVQYEQSATRPDDLHRETYGVVGSWRPRPITGLEPARDFRTHGFVCPQITVGSAPGWKCFCQIGYSPQ